MTNYGKYDVMKKNRKGEILLYKVCPNRGYAYVVATNENTKQYAKGIYIADPRFVDYYIRLHKENAWKNFSKKFSKSVDIFSGICYYIVTGRDTPKKKGR